MARRLPPQQQAAAGDAPAADQLAELVPNLSITIAGRDLVIREYGAFEGLEVAAQAAGLMGDMVAIGRTRELTWSEMRRLIGKHSGEALAIAARSADVEPDWVRGLNRQDLEQFLSAWFGVNVGFFVHEVLAQLQDEAVRKALAQAGTKILARLAAGGLGDLERLGRMTERQLLGFYDASIRLEASSRANEIEDTAAAIGVALGDKAAATRPQQLRNLK